MASVQMARVQRVRRVRSVDVCNPLDRRVHALGTVLARAALALVHIRITVAAAEPRPARALVRVNFHSRTSRRRLAADRAVRAWRARALVHIHVAAASRGAVVDVHVARRRVLRDVAVHTIISHHTR